MRETIWTFAIVAGLILLVGVFVLMFASIYYLFEPKSCQDYPKYRYDRGSVPVKCYEEVKL